MSSPLSVQFTRDNNGSVTQTRRYSDATGTNLVSTTDFGRDSVGNLTSQVHKGSGGTTVATYTNIFDVLNRITRETRNGVATNDSYDATSQVTSSGNQNYSYDPNGNRTMGGYTTGIWNQITSDGTWNYSYDAVGNVVKKVAIATGRTWTYGYDLNNRMTWSEKRTYDGGGLLQRVDFVYDVFGNRLRQTVNSTTTRYAFEGSRIWAELDGNGNITTRYLLGEGDSAALARSDSTGAHWLLQDRLGSVREVLDSSGSLVAQINYDSAGNQTSNTNAAQAGNLLWQGMYNFSATGLYDTPARDYDPTTARWYETDPANADINTYRGMGNDGTNATDPSGLEPQVGESAEYWKKEAAKLIDVGDVKDSMQAAIARNKLITAAYANFASKNLFNPVQYLWMGAAAFASRDVGNAMKGMRKDYRDAALEKDFRDAKMTLFQTAFNSLADGNKAVFDDLYWQHLAFEKGGIDLMKKLKDNGDITDKQFQAWQKIGSGIADLKLGKEEGLTAIAEGNKMMFEHEQKEILQKIAFGPIHDLLAAGKSLPFFNVLAGAVQINLNQMASPPFAPFTLFSTWAKGKKIAHPDITNANQRYQWGVEQFLQSYVNAMMDNDPTKAMMKIQSMVDGLKALGKMK